MPGARGPWECCGCRLRDAKRLRLRRRLRSCTSSCAMRAVGRMPKHGPQRQSARLPRPKRLGFPTPTPACAAGAAVAKHAALRARRTPCFVTEIQAVGERPAGCDAGSVQSLVDASISGVPPYQGRSTRSGKPWWTLASPFTAVWTSQLLASDELCLLCLA
eukprot:350266-Chlamydomonas_euryale.AAC.5